MSGDATTESENGRPAKHGQGLVLDLCAVCVPIAAIVVYVLFFKPPAEVPRYLEGASLVTRKEHTLAAATRAAEEAEKAKDDELRAALQKALDELKAERKAGRGYVCILPDRSGGKPCDCELGDPLCSCL
ncbi:hypothetical protein [Polyangium sp. 15x6]|uniref:hypothetical protein n=1 Tax=Polyangium sp. 15x6 TaxID=3042687 RepID=UPI00249B9737|nr:hypothetical protein [Polyangium sp. 15x6]MDI3284472.1 hypothetical protein [Polyangium sp. 15x6]